MEVEGVEVFEEEMKLYGQAEADTWVNLYLYSGLPLVMTTKTDASGNVSMNENKLLIDKLTIYPNPTNDKIKIKTIIKDAFVEISNLNGQILYTKELNNQLSVQIDISSYSKGIYFVKVYGQDIIKVEKIIIY
jgi:hypothetical protein